MNKYSVIVRIRVKGSKHDVTGRSTYSSGSYDRKFKNAIINAVFIDASNRRKKLRYDTIFDYSLKNHSIAYISGKTKKAKKGANRRLHNEIRLENARKGVKIRSEKEQDKPISRKEQLRELGLTRTVLKADIKEERKASRDYSKLSKRLKGRDRMTVKRIAKQELKHSKVLSKIDQREYKEYLRLKKKFKG